MTRVEGSGSVQSPTGLLRGYGRILDSIDSPKVGRGRTEDGRTRRLGTARVLVRFFVLHHLSRSLDALGRAYHRGEALNPGDGAYEEAIKQLNAFQKSLPPLRTRLLLLLALILVLFTASLLARLLPDIDPTGVFLLEEGSTASAPTIREAAAPLRRLTNSVLTLSPSELPEALKSFGCVPPEEGQPTTCSVRRAAATTIASLVLIAGTLWLITLPILPSFAAKRRLFAYQPSPLAGPGATEPSPYEREAALFALLRARPPREFPADLLSQGSLLILPFWLAGVTVVWFIYVLRDVGDFRVPGDITLIALVLYCELVLVTITVARLLSLLRKRRERELKFARGATERTYPVSTWAGRRRRTLAYLIDLAMLAAIILSFVLPLRSVVEGNEGRILALSFLAPALAAILYELPWFALRRESFGKALLGIRLVTREGTRPTVYQLFLRNVGLKAFLMGPWFVLLFLLLPSVNFEDYDYILEGLLIALSVPLLVVILNHVFALRRTPAALHDLIARTAVVEDHGRSDDLALEPSVHTRTLDSALEGQARPVSQRDRPG